MLSDSQLTIANLNRELGKSVANKNQIMSLNEKCISLNQALQELKSQQESDQKSFKEDCIAFEDVIAVKNSEIENLRNSFEELKVFQERSAAVGVENVFLLSLF